MSCQHEAWALGLWGFASTSLLDIKLSQLDSAVQHASFARTGANVPAESISKQH